MELVYIRVAGIFGMVKGAIIAVTTTGLGIPFWQSLIIAAVSGIIGFFGAITAAFVAAREARKTRGLVRDVKRKLGADHRVRDEEID